MHIEIKRICVSTDFSPSSDQAIHYGVALAETHDAELRLLHITNTTLFWRISHHGRRD